MTEKLCIGRYAPILIKDNKRTNEQLANGVPIEEIIEYEHTHFKVMSNHARTPHLLVAYMVEGMVYYHAASYPLNSPILQVKFFDQEVVISYQEDNPWISEIKAMKVEDAIAQYGIIRPDYDQFPAIDNLDYFGLHYLKQTKYSAPVATANMPNSNPYKDNYKTTKLETIALVLGILSIIPPILGTISIFTAIAAIIMAIISFKTPMRNRVMPRNAIIFAGIGLCVSPLATIVYIYYFFEILLMILNILSIM